MAFTSPKNPSIVVYRNSESRFRWDKDGEVPKIDGNKYRKLCSFPMSVAYNRSVKHTRQKNPDLIKSTRLMLLQSWNKDFRETYCTSSDKIPIKKGDVICYHDSRFNYPECKIFIESSAYTEKSPQWTNIVDFGDPKIVPPKWRSKLFGDDYER